VLTERHRVDTLCLRTQPHKTVEVSVTKKQQ